MDGRLCPHNLCKVSIILMGGVGEGRSEGLVVGKDRKERGGDSSDANKGETVYVVLKVDAS